LAVPRGERLVIALGSAGPIEDAIRLADRELVRWLEAAGAGSCWRRICS
jgi:hypothetical protein